MRKVGRRNGEAAQEVIFIYKRRKRCTRSPRLPVFFHSLRSSLQFSRMGTPQEAPALASTKDGKKGEREATSRSCTIVAHDAKVHLTWQIHNSLTLCRVKRHPPRLTNGHWQMPVSEDSGAWSSTPSHSTFVSRGYVRYLRQRYLNRGVEFLDIVTVNRGYDVSRMVSRMVLKYIKFGNCLVRIF